MTDEPKKTSKKAQFIAVGVVAVLLGGLWLLKTLNPEAYQRSGIKSFLESPSRQAVRDDAFVHCELHAKKVYDAGEVLNAQSSRYDYTFTCKAKQEVVLSDITIVVGEGVTGRNTGVGRDEKSERRLDSDRIPGTVTVKAGEQYEKTSRLTRRSSVSGSRGYVEPNGRIWLPASADESLPSPKTFLHLRTPAS